MLNQSIVYENNQIIQKTKGKAKSNEISTTLYNRYNFIPYGLWNQVTLITNIWFILIAILTVIPIFKTVNPVSSILPLGIVIGFSLLLDWYEDFKRFKRDYKINNTKVKIIREGKYIEIKSKDIRVGDIQILAEDERASADLLVLAYESNFDFCFIDTKSLDGEKSLKPKLSILPRIDPGVAFEIDLNYLRIDLAENTRNLHFFNGRIHQEESQQVDLDYFIPKSAQLKNTFQMYGIVLYIGKDSKISLNTQKRIFKQSTIEKNLNKYILWVFLVLFLILVLICLMAVLYHKKNQIDHIMGDYDSTTKQFFVTLASYLILLNQFLPISLIITLHLLNLFQKLEFSRNKQFNDKSKKLKSVYNTINLAQELGQIEYVLSDKTGTLTQNKMICRFFQIGNQSMDLQPRDDEWFYQTTEDAFLPEQLISDDGQIQLVINTQEEMELIFFLLLNSCHTCFAMYQDNSSIQNYQGSSPDEVAILNSLRTSCRFFLKDTTNNANIIKDKQNNRNMIAKKVFVFDFDSDRKLMSCIIELDGQFYLFAKGADTSIIERSKNELSDKFKLSVQKFYESGFRIMFMAIRIMSKEEVENFMKNLIDLEKNGTFEQLYDYKKSLENNLHIIGCSVVEDKLQEGLRDTLDSLKQAKVKVWVITGDKRDTAINIAFQAGLFEDTNPLFFEGELAEKVLRKRIKKQQNFKQEWLRKKFLIQNALQATTTTNFSLGKTNSLAEFMEQVGSNNKNLVVNQNVLELALADNQTSKRFYRFIRNYKCILFCRTSPHQKVQIVRLLQKQNIRVLAIGDGQNDVNMIQEANVGIGIIGEEGNQAKNASDIAIPKFKYLKPLIFDFGRQIYYRNSMFVLFFFYKNILFVIPQFYYAFYSMYSGVNFYNDWYLSLYNTIFTAFLIPGFTVSNRDFDKKAPYFHQSLIQNTYTYFYGQKNYLFSQGRFLMWFLYPMLEALYIFMMNQKFFANNSYSYYHPYTWSINFLVYLNVIFYHQIFKCLFITFQFGFFFFLGLFCNLISYYVFIIASDYYDSIGIYNGLNRTYGTQIFYLVILFHCGSLNFFTQFYYVIKRYIYPHMKDNIRSIKEYLDEQYYEWFLRHNREETEKKWFMIQLINNEKY